MLDQADSFGWISILVHWLTTVLVIALWFIGRSITEQGSLEAVDARRSLHCNNRVDAVLGPGLRKCFDKPISIPNGLDALKQRVETGKLVRPRRSAPSEPQFVPVPA